MPVILTTISGGLPPAPPRAVAKITRKIGLLGSHGSSLTDCPWDDPTWELWAHASSRAWYRREPDLYFELHRPARWKHEKKKGPNYFRWLCSTTVPIMMQEKHPEIPASRRYPKDRILQEFGTLRPYFTNTVSWMIALALTQSVTHLGLWGISYSSKGEYAIQRGCAEYWLGRAEQAGVHIILPKQCSLLREPAALYGYESHDETGALIDEYQQKEFRGAENLKVLRPGEAFERLAPPEEIRRQIAAEEEAYPRPEWAKVRNL